MEVCSYIVNLLTYYVKKFRRVDKRVFRCNATMSNLIAFKNGVSKFLCILQKCRIEKTVCGQTRVGSTTFTIHAKFFYIDVRRRDGGVNVTKWP